MERSLDKVEKYAKKLCEEIGGKYIDSNLSTYYNVRGRILRISDHIGSNSSGSMSIIIPKFNVIENTYILHVHSSGEISIIDYEKLKMVIKSFFYVSSLFMSINQPNFEMEFQKIEKFNDSEKFKEMTAEINRLKQIEKKFNKVKEFYEERIKLEKNKTDASTTEKEPIYVDSKDTVFGVPKKYFESGQLKVITQTANKVKTKFGLDIQIINDKKEAESI